VAKQDIGHPGQCHRGEISTIDQPDRRFDAQQHGREQGVRPFQPKRSEQTLMAFAECLGQQWVRGMIAAKALARNSINFMRPR